MVLTILKQVHGVIEGDKVVWRKEGEIFREKIDSKVGEVQYFYGVPELGHNVMWKDFDADPSIFLNFYHKSKSRMKPLHVLRREKQADGKYHIDTVISSVEIMKIFDETLCKVFAESEVLSLYNIHGEGLSLTKME